MILVSIAWILVGIVTTTACYYIFKLIEYLQQNSLFNGWCFTPRAVVGIVFLSILGPCNLVFLLATFITLIIELLMETTGNWWSTPICRKK